ncbi:MAG: hypothetical protein JRJ27_04900 [Deltaproteobacteria bacterium]|nr:hypothetical protein [Deltaproteobacteria bacterium]MBW2365845.1 hypothetical protein [Deltaproteobacteria bacterium]
MPRKRDFACAQQAASKGEAIVKLLRILSNAAYGSLRFAHRVKIDEKKEINFPFTI